MLAEGYGISRRRRSPGMWGAGLPAPQSGELLATRVRDASCTLGTAAAVSAARRAPPELARVPATAPNFARAPGRPSRGPPPPAWVHSPLRLHPPGRPGAGLSRRL